MTLANRPGEQFPAHVAQVDPVGTTVGQLVRYGAVLGFDRVPADALVGQTADVRVTIDSVSSVLRVPAGAVHPTDPAAPSTTDGTGQVRLRTPAGGTERRRVTVGVRGDRYVEIVGGLAEGDEVVLDW